MLIPPVAVRRGPLWFAVLGQGLSTGLGFAALGLALYAQGPTGPAAAALFGAVGGVVGAASALVRLARDGVPAALPLPMPADELASLLRTTLAEAQRQRQASRVGSVADRRPAVAVLPTTPAPRPASASPAPAESARSRAMPLDTVADPA